MHHSHHGVWVGPLTFLGCFVFQLLYNVYQERRVKRLAAQEAQRIFDYRTQLWPYFIAIAGLSVPGFILWMLSRAGKSFSEVGWPLSIAMTLFMLLFAGAMSAGPLAALFVIIDGKRRTTQRIMVDAEQMMFEDRTTTLATTWDEVTDYYHCQIGHLQPLRYYVVTAKGNIEFTSAIKEARLLRAIIERQSIHAAVPEWTERKETAPGLHENKIIQQ